MSFKNEIYLQEVNIKLLYNDWVLNSSIRGVREVKVVKDNEEFIMFVDVRFNELNFKSTPLKTSCDMRAEIKYLKNKYGELKLTDFRYKRGGGFEGSLSIHLEDFINHLKKGDRDYKIEKILKK